MSEIQKIDCTACKSEKTMTPKKIYRMSGLVVGVGWLLTIPSLLGVVIGLILLIATGNVASDQMASIDQASQSPGKNGPQIYTPFCSGIQNINMDK